MTPNQELGELPLTFFPPFGSPLCICSELHHSSSHVKLQYFGISSTVVTITVHISAIVLPLKYEATFCGFNLEGYSAPVCTDLLLGC